MTQENPDIQKPTSEDLPVFAWAHHWTTQNYEIIQVKTKHLFCLDLVQGHSSCEITSQPTLDGLIRTRCGGELHNTRLRVFHQLETPPSYLHTFLIPLPETRRCWHFYFANCVQTETFILKTPSFELCLFPGPFMRRKLKIHAEADHEYLTHHMTHHTEPTELMIHTEASHYATSGTPTHYESDEFGETETTGYIRG